MKQAKQRWVAGEPPAPPTVRTNNRCNPSFYRVPISCIRDFWYSLRCVRACATNCQVVVVCLSVVVGTKTEVFLRRPAVCSFIPQVIALLISRWAISLQQMVACFTYSSGCLCGSSLSYKETPTFTCDFMNKVNPFITGLLLFLHQPV